jgi:transposase
MGRVVIGMDPHKRSATIAVLDEAEQPVMTGRFGTDREGYRLLLAAGRQFGQRVWAVEGCEGVGRHLAQRLVADGEPVVDVPAKLSARVRVFSTGQGRKTDATDAHSVAVVALRTPTLQPVRPDDRTVALRLLADRRDELGAARTLIINRLHRLLVELVPGGAKRALTARQARGLLADVAAGDATGDVVRETRRQLAVELVDELEVIDARIKTAKKQLAGLVAETCRGLMQLNGIGPSGAARLLGDIGDVSRFPTKAHFASWNGTAPLDASSGEQTRHRLSRAGNRRINRALHIMAVVQLRHPSTDGRRYYDRRVAEGKTPMEAMRALKRRLSNVIYRQLVNDQKQQKDGENMGDTEARRTGSEGHLGTTTKSSAAGSNPNADASDKSLSEPADIDATPTPGPSPDRTSTRSPGL